MANAVPQWLLAKNLTISAKLVTVAGGTGVMTVGSNAINFFGILDTTPWTASNELDKVSISPSDNPYRNKVIVEQGSTYVLTEILQAIAVTAPGTADTNTGLYTNGIEALAKLGYHYQFTVVWKDNAGGTVTNMTETIYLQYVSHAEEYVKGKSTMKMTLETFAYANGGAFSGGPVFS